MMLYPKGALDKDVKFNWALAKGELADAKLTLKGCGDCGDLVLLVKVMTWSPLPSELGDTEAEKPRFALFNAAAMPAGVSVETAKVVATEGYPTFTVKLKGCPPFKLVGGN